MSNFSSKTKYVEARPRREKKLGRGGSVVSVAASSGGSGVSKSYVDSNFVTLATEQTIPGAKDFVGGIKVNGMPITYNAELGVWGFTGDLFVTGNFAWGSSIDGFKPSTVMDAVRVDGSTIIKKKDSNGDWYLYAPGGGSGGSGGGLTLGDVASYLSDNDYTTKADVNSLIASSLAGYATEQWVANKGYLTSSALVGYATQSWVGDNYLAKSGGTITGASGALTIARSDADQIGILFSGASGNLGFIGFSGSNTPAYIDYDGNAYPILHSGNIGQQSVNRAASAGAADSVSVTPVTESGNYSLALLPSSSTRTQGVCVGNNHRALFNPSTGALTAASFVGNLTGNADSATLLGNRAVSAQDFDALNFANNGLYCFDGDYANGVGLPPYYSWNYSVLNMGLASGRRQQIAIPYDTVKMFVRTNVDDAWKTWREVAFTDSNVDSATKLETPRTIWGQSFDGTEDITGSPSFPQYININRNAATGAIMNSPLLGCEIEAYSSHIAFKSYGSDGGGISSHLCLIKGGNVAIGDTTADAKLHVHGTTILGGDTTINGNLLVYGNVSWFSHSQRSLKNIVSEQGLSLAQLERIKPIKFYWKDGRDMALHVGGVADVFAEVLPEVVARNLQDILCLNYVDAAFYVGASLIAPVLDHERRITKGEAEQEALKKENAKLKRELEEVKSKLNHLAA